MIMAMKLLKRFVYFLIQEDEKNELEYSHSEFGEIEIKDIPRVKKLSSKY